MPSMSDDVFRLDGGEYEVKLKKDYPDFSFEYLGCRATMTIYHWNDDEFYIISKATRDGCRFHFNDICVMHEMITVKYFYFFKRTITKIAPFIDQLKSHTAECISAIENEAHQVDEKQKTFNSVPEVVRVKL